MKHNVVAPSVGESITEVSILKWLKKSGEAVKSGEMILEIESDKATVEIVAEASGALEILKEEGETVPVGEQVATIDDSQQGSVSSSDSTSKTETSSSPPQSSTDSTSIPLSPAVRKAVTEQGINPKEISGTGKNGRITKGDVLKASQQSSPASTPQKTSESTQDKPGDRRVPMTRLRKTIAKRLVNAQQTAAILTTFNEVDMKPLMDLRNKYKDAFKAKYGTSMSIMSFFTRASVHALHEIPGVNASVDGEDIIYHDYQNIGIAVGTEKGLVVAVIKNAGEMGMIEIDSAIAELAKKARSGKLSIDDMAGGTFTISNGGTYGSMLSTPILTPPQTGILGMHAIKERPIAVDGKIEIRPMMYLALSYDHRLIDGKEAVTFLINMKEHLEHPEKLGLGFLNEL